MLANPLMDARQLLEWYLEAGVDEAADETAVNYFTAAPAPVLRETSAIAVPVADAVAAVLADMPPETGSAPARPAAPAAPALHHIPSAAMAAARELAEKASTLAELEAAVRGFDGCAIKKTASKTVFADGNPAARVMIIGEAPGAQEDLQGIPFCGPSGALLDKMFAAIGLNRADSLYISNTVFWRPPGNRQPSQEEITICQPFVEKHIALVKPDLLILSGGTATTAVLRKETSVSRLRGRLYPYTNPYITEPVQTLVTFHPSYLLRSPAQKRLAWHDLLLVREFLNKPTITS